uniref:Ena/VASP-like protein n=1 Tax=Stegastes partitus TaxID=144197 RepID=A0A3B4Z343_9TELE
EQSICQARASVMKWVPIKPGQQGFSRINIYHNTANNTFRVVGVKLQDQQVVINYSIVKGLKYNQATPTFHQWRDARQVYGLNFASKEEATTFSNAMLFALNVLSAQDGPALQRHVQNGPTSDEIEAQRMMEQQQQMQAHMERERRSSNSSPFQGHPAVLSVAPPVIPPPMNMGGPPPPPPPPGPPPPSAMAPQPPLPPPLPIGGGSHGDEPPAPTGLAAMIAGAKLRRVQRSQPEDSSSSGAKNDANRTSGGSGGLMEEMNALLARRKAASEKPEDSQNVRAAGSSSDTDSLDLDRMKQEILEEVFRELHKVKDEIIDIRHELSRVSTT